ncbi:metallophosphoesterase family protein ['Paenibacillus yunnanensis' Narsing Rao et al. 2020]|uniref:metallophosphoesterase family protein n=1 Tax=Paenibacillus tengchongensis TaxID=2608684 RepID=UPI00124D250E|nr:DNA repair exonuclease [Paenibacillus tengchongensis]
MEAFRFLHAADLHLDSRFAGLSGLPQPIRSYLKESTFAALGRLVRLAVEQEVDFIVISGDVYDVSDASLQGQLRFREALQELGGHGIAVYIIHGNHDPLDGPRLNSGPPPLVTVFGGVQPEQAIARRRSDGKEVAVVTGISYPTAKVTENTALKYSRIPGSTLFHIAMLHGNVDGDLQHETYSPCTRKDLLDRGFDYWALGHIHKRQILQESPPIVYPGNIQSRSVKETGPKGCYIVEVDAGGVPALTFHELDAVRWEIRELSIEGMADEAEWTGAAEQAVEALRQELPGMMTVVRFRITGRGAVHRSLARKGAADDLLTELRRRDTLRAERGDYAGLVWVESFSIESGLPVDRERLLAEDSFLGEMLRLSAGIQESPAALEELVTGALRPLLEQQELRRLLSSAGESEKLGWLQNAVELSIALLSGDEEQEPPGDTGLPSSREQLLPGLRQAREETAAALQYNRDDAGRTGDDSAELFSNAGDPLHSRMTRSADVQDDKTAADANERSPGGQKRGDAT